MKQVLFVASRFPSYDETFIMREMLEVKRRGLGVKILSLKSRRDPVVHDEFRELDGCAIYLPYFFSLSLWGAHLSMMARKPGAYWRTLWFFVFSTLGNPAVCAKTCVTFIKAVAVARCCGRLDIGWIHGQWATYPASAAWMISRLTGIPFSFTGHAHDIYLDTTLLREKIAAADHVLTCTAANKRHLESFCAEPDKIIVSYHGLDREKFKASASFEAEHAPRILGLGSLLECKGFGYLIEACRILRERGITVHCDIVGGGPLHKALHWQIEDAGLGGQVVLHGYKKQSEVIPFYQSADVFVLPAVLEIHWGIPNVIIEALACGVPFVCTPLPSLREINAAGECGVEVPQKDARALADAIEALVKDPLRRVRMGEAGRRQVAEKFDLAVNAARVADRFKARMAARQAAA